MLNNENSNLEQACLFFVNQHIVLRVLANEELIIYIPSVSHLFLSRHQSHLSNTSRPENVIVKHRVSDIFQYINMFRYILKGTYFSISLLKLTPKSKSLKWNRIAKVGAASLL